MYIKKHSYITPIPPLKGPLASGDPQLGFRVYGARLVLERSLVRHSDG